MMYITVDTAVELLKNGHVAAIPTETVYGLAASLAQEKAIADIFTLKGRPPQNPLIVHVYSADEIFQFCRHLKEKSKQELAKLCHFWPGPLSVVLPVDVDKVPNIARAGLQTAAFRIPAHPIAREILKHTGPLVMPSANLSGRPSATTAQHVADDFGEALPIVDGGKCQKGLESTVLLLNEDDFENPIFHIIRQGALAPEDFRETLGYLPIVESKDAVSKSMKPICPGQLFKHYSPKAKLTLLKEIPSDHQGLILGYEERTYPKKCSVVLIGSLNNPEGVAKNLYSHLRKLDTDNITKACIDFDTPLTGLWTTIRERLSRAAETT